MKKITALILGLLLLCAGFAPVPGVDAAYAQTNQIELRGTIIDETNAYIVAAPVTLDDGKGNKFTATADERGRYRFMVTPGVYTLSVEVEGFGKFAEQIEVTSKRAAPFDVKLKVVLNEQVEVQDNSAVVSTEPDKNLSAITLTEKDLEALPDDPDELLETLKQMAGAAGGADAQVYVGGFHERGQLPPKEAILRVNISQNPYSAEFSEPGSSRIEIITKPGSDTYHGGFNFNFNDEALNARDAFATFRAPFQYRRYGGYFSGPIIRNRWGFFFDMQRNENDGNDYVNVVVLDPITFLPTPFSATILTPSRNTNFSIRSDYLATKKHTIGAQFRHSENESLRSGGNAFTLPERASNSSSSEDTLRFSLTTIASEHAVNEMRVQLSRRESTSRGLSNDVAINVLDSFNGGSSQAFTDNANRNLDLTNNFTFTHKTHTLKAGFRAEAVQPNNLNRSNFGGTFTFGQDFERDAAGAILVGADGAPVPISSIELYSRVVRGVPGYRPSQFSINRGDPFVGFSQWQYGWFAQDDWKVSQRLFLSYGVRQELQTHLQDKWNLAPRFSVAWNPDKARKTTIRAGGGIFYTYLDSGITAETIRLDGGHQQQFVIQQPNFFETIPPNIEDGTTPRLPTTRQKSAGLNDPYQIVVGASYERPLPLKLFGSGGYTWIRGVHLLRSRNINAPRFFDGVPVFPFPEGPILEYESTGFSTRHEMRVNVRTGFSQKITLFANYTLASTHNNTDGANSNPANPYDLSTEWGRAGSDVRHNFFVGGSMSAPWGLRINPFVTASSGRPFNILTGRDNNRDNQYTDRPSLANADDPGAIVTSFGVFNPTPLAGEQIIPRNFGQGPGFVSVNLSVSKTFGFGPPPNSYRSAANNANQQNTQPGQGQNQRDGNQNQRGANQRAGNQNRGGGAAAPGGSPQMVMRGGPPGGGVGGAGGGNFMMMGGGGDGRHKYNLTISISGNDLFNHPNLAQYNGVLTSPFFGVANATVGSRGGFGGGGSRRIDLGLRFSF
ncbi:MAG: carboxypeptidase regulatory-like domain-containing protein [Acidobacteriota bacterium]